MVSSVDSKSKLDDACKKLSRLEHPEMKRGVSYDDGGQALRQSMQTPPVDQNQIIKAPLPYVARTLRKEKSPVKQQSGFKRHKLSVTNKSKSINQSVAEPRKSIQNLRLSQLIQTIRVDTVSTKERGESKLERIHR